MSGLILIDIFLILVIPYMAWTSRMAGHGLPHLPWITDQLLFALPFLFFWPLMGYWAILAYVVGVAGKLSGTRQYLDMGWDKEPIRKPNNVDFIIKCLQGKISDYWYDFLGNTLVGILPVLGAIVGFLATGHYLAALIIFLSGALRGAAYMIGWAVRPDYKGKWLNATELAEVLTGAFVGVGVALIYIISQ